MRIFIGREEALEALQSDLLGPSRYTIANIHGIGGVGKTTLKAEVLLRLQEGGAMIPVFHADENIARSDMAEFIGALAESFHQPWEGEPADFSRVRRARHRLRELKGRLARERDGALLDGGLRVALSGLARRALLARRPPDQPAADP
ncbi:MAG: ATP-binding protein, partial [Candidatus Sericytochromatia bacterium]|nr:ATP-binding protein [Candidatus Tanganyikabacteria bacterium]